MTSNHVQAVNKKIKLLKQSFEQINKHQTLQLVN